MECHGASVDSRRCRFENICLRPDTGDYFVVHGPDTELHGVPADRFNPALLTLSSVQNHNAMHMTFTDLPAAALASITGIHVVEDPVFVLKRFKPNNVMHVLHDDIFPLHHTLHGLGVLPAPSSENATARSGVALVFTDGWGPQTGANNLEWLYEAFSSHLPLFDRSIPDSVSMVCFRDAHLGLSKASTWYDYGTFT